VDCVGLTLRLKLCARPRYIHRAPRLKRVRADCAAGASRTMRAPRPLWFVRAPGCLALPLCTAELVARELCQPLLDARTLMSKPMCSSARPPASKCPLASLARRATTPRHPCFQALVPDELQLSAVLSWCRHLSAAHAHQQRSDVPCPICILAPPSCQRRPSSPRSDVRNCRRAPSDV
jgi:hypothetical protein